MQITFIHICLTMKYNNNKKYCFFHLTQIKRKRIFFLFFIYSILFMWSVQFRITLLIIYLERWTTIIVRLMQNIYKKCNNFKHDISQANIEWKGDRNKMCACRQPKNKKNLLNIFAQCLRVRLWIFFANKRRNWEERGEVRKMLKRLKKNEAFRFHIISWIMSTYSIFF